MVRLDHLALPVGRLDRSRRWYTGNLGLRVEFEIPERRTAALQDDAGLTLFIFESTDESIRPSCTLTFQVDDVDGKFLELSGRGVKFEQPRAGTSGDMALNSGTRMVTWYICGMKNPCGKKAVNDPGLNTGNGAD